MTKYKIIFNGEEQDEVFDSYEEAEDYALGELTGAYHEGRENFWLSNPGDYSYDPNVDPDFEIIEE